MKMGDGDKKVKRIGGRKIEAIYREVFEELKKNQKEIFEESEFDDNFNEYVFDHLSVGAKGCQCSACDDCRKKQIITEQYNRVCAKEYIPPYVDLECRDFKLSLVIQRIDSKIIETAFSYLIYRVSIREILCNIEDPEWKRDAETLLVSVGFNNFITENFGKISKNLIIQMLFDVNFCYFNIDYRRNLNQNECLLMLKYYFVFTIRDRIKESLYKIAKLIELELEYRIAVIEGEIKYIIRCILQEIAITPLPSPTYNITHFNMIGSLTDLLRIFNGVDGGRHDQRSDFRSIRDTIKKYEKVVRTSLELLNKKIKEYGDLTEQRSFIVGITGVCDKQGFFNNCEHGGAPLIVPPTPVVVLNPPGNRVNDDND